MLRCLKGVFHSSRHLDTHITGRLSNVGVLSSQKAPKMHKRCERRHDPPGFFFLFCQDIAQLYWRMEHNFFLLCFCAMWTALYLRPWHLWTRSPPPQQSRSHLRAHRLRRNLSLWRSCPPPSRDKPSPPRLTFLSPQPHAPGKGGQQQCAVRSRTFQISLSSIGQYHDEYASIRLRLYSPARVKAGLGW